LSYPKQINPIALIVPHAGYIYSGFIAGSAYSQIIDNHYENIFIIGPSHNVEIKMPCVSSFDFFETPFGNLQVNMNVINDLIEKKIVIQNDLAHIEEHSLEVQLPFLGYIYKDTKKVPKIIPILLNNFSKDLADYLENYKKNSLIIVSSDLSHYYDSKTAETLDHKIITDILELNEKTLSKDEACGLAGIKTIVRFANNLKLKPVFIDYIHSGFTTKNLKEVVGYTAIGFKN
jgi:AmmeMemoRadiSam system protein B